MGNNSTSPNSNNAYVHPRLGNIKRVQQKNNQHSILYQIILDNQKLYEDWTKELQTIRQYEGAYQILFLPCQHYYQQTTYCGTGGYAQLSFEDYLYSLEPEILNRKSILRPFSEQEIIYLFYSLIKIQAILDSKNKFIGDVKPQNILVNDDGYVKIICQYSWPEYSNKILRSWQKDNQRLFLSPQECEQRYKRKSVNFQSLNRNQSEVFSIGLSILEAGTLRDCSQIYGFTSEYRFNQSKMRELIDIFQQRYSRELTRLLKEMLCPNPRKRIKAQTIYKILRPFQYLILNLQQIVIKLPSSESLAKVDRQEKISIKRAGDSQFSTNQNHEYAKFQVPYQQANIQNSNYTKISLGQNMHPPIQSNIYTNSQPNLFGSSLQSGAYYPMKQSITNLQAANYQLVNQHSSYNRQMNSPSSHQKTYFLQEDRQAMMHSLPLNLGQYQLSLNPNKPQYLTQNSMVEARTSQEPQNINY